MVPVVPIIRTCEPRDVPSVTQIYAHHVLYGLASFEEEPPDVVEMERRRAQILARGFVYLVGEVEGEIVGYAYVAPYRSRPAYRYTVENSVYVHPDFLRQGIGHVLLSNLIDQCEQKGFRQIVAVIGDSAHHASIGLHERLGFRLAGTLYSVGFKFGRWVDTVLMQRELGDPTGMGLPG